MYILEVFLCYFIYYYILYVPLISITLQAVKLQAVWANSDNRIKFLLRFIGINKMLDEKRY